MDICLLEFDIYQDTLAPKQFGATQTLDVLHFLSKKALSDVRPEINLVQRNIVSTGQSVWV